MDNNFNQQPVYQQPVYQQAPKNSNTTELVALILSGVGAFLAILGSILTCSCSASKSFETNVSDLVGAGLGMLTGGATSVEGTHATSWVAILAIVGAIIAAAGAVMGIIAIKNKKAGKLTYVAVAVGVFGCIYGILPVLMICGYNCSLNSNYEDSMGAAMDSIGGMFGDMSDMMR